MPLLSSTRLQYLCIYVHPYSTACTPYCGWWFDGIWRYLALFGVFGVDYNCTEQHVCLSLSHAVIRTRTAETDKRRTATTTTTKKKVHTKNKKQKTKNPPEIAGESGGEEEASHMSQIIFPVTIPSPLSHCHSHNRHPERDCRT